MLAAHLGVRGTLATISQLFWLTTIACDICRLVASCPVYAQTKSSNSETSVPSVQAFILRYRRTLRRVKTAMCQTRERT